MKASIIKKSLVCALAVSLVTAPVLGVSAATPTTVTGGGSSESVVVEAVNAVIASVTTSEGTFSGASEVSSISEAVAAIPVTSSVGGVTTTVKGAYLVNSVPGVAVTTPLATLTQGYGLAAGEQAYAMVWDLDPKKSNLAKQVIDLAAASQGAEVGPMLNMEFGKKSGGKYSLLPSDGPAIRLSVGVPANFAQNDKTYAVVRVRPGGAVSILTDVDSNPNTVTFDTTGGAGAYAIIRY